jgi:hypothetical protein
LHKFATFGLRRDAEPTNSASGTIFSYPAGRVPTFLDARPASSTGKFGLTHLKGRALVIRVSEYRASHSDSSSQQSSISVPFVIAAAVLIGVGVFTISYALTIWDGWYLVGIAPLFLGATLLFSQRTGLDRA